MASVRSYLQNHRRTNVGRAWLGRHYNSVTGTLGIWRCAELLGRSTFDKLSRQAQAPAQRLSFVILAIVRWTPCEWPLKWLGRICWDARRAPLPEGSAQRPHQRARQSEAHHSRFEYWSWRNSTGGYQTHTSGRVEGGQWSVWNRAQSADFFISITFNWDDNVWLEVCWQRPCHHLPSWRGCQEFPLLQTLPQMPQASG